MPVVSVVMPVYNASGFLKMSIDSILNQSLTDFEFIIINDGSTDESHNIISSYNDVRIKYINNSKNQGLVKCLNEAIGTARSNYIARMDADDVAYKDRLILQIDYLLKNRAVKLVGSQVRLIDIDSKPFGFWNYPTNLNDIKRELKNNCCFAHPSVVFEKNIFDEMGGYSMNYQVAGEDYDLWKKILDKYEGVNLDCVLVDYRIQPNSFSSKNLLKQSLASLAIQRNIPVYNNVSVEILLDKGLTQIEISDQVVNSFLFWIELYRKMYNYIVCDNLLIDLKLVLMQLPNNRKNIIVTKYEIKYNFFLLRFVSAVKLYYQYLFIDFFNK